MNDVLTSWHARTDPLPGRWSLCARGDGIDLSADDHRPHPAASVIKLPILASVLELVDAGRLSLSDRVGLEGPDVGGAGALKYLGLASVTLGQALSLMITISDNVATNAVIDHVGLAELTGSWERHGNDGFALNRLLGQPARGPEEDNHASADAAVTCLLDLDDRAQRGDAAARFGIGLLAEQQIRDRIPSALPDDVTCLNKTGELAEVRHDVALLRRGGRRVAVAMLSSGVTGVGTTTGGGVAASVMGRTAADLVDALGT